MNYIKRVKSLLENKYLGMYIYKYYKYNIYPKITNKPKIELICVNSNGVKYEIIWSNQISNITLNGRSIKYKKYSDTRSFIWVPNSDGILCLNNILEIKLKVQTKPKITDDSIIIISDRFEKADDNGEFFYEWILRNKPNYKNVYFALSENSNHYPRLKNKGFKLLSFESKLFRQIYKQADVIASSVSADYIENHKQLRYSYFNPMPHSKFYCLQHGVGYGGNDNHNTSTQCVNYLILSTEYERQAFAKSKVWFEEQQPIIGMSRINAFTPKDSNKILYMPSWTTEAFNSSNIANSLLYKSIESLVLDKTFIHFLITHNLTMELVIHPQVATNMTKWKELSSPNISVVSGVNFSYAKEISKCRMLITDMSSIVFDAISAEKKVLFFQPDDNITYNSPRIQHEIAEVATSIPDLINLITDYAIIDKTQYINEKFIITDSKHINERLWELIING